MKSFKLLMISSALLFASVSVHAAGMLPQASVVIVEEADGEGSIDIKNTDSHVSILLTTVENTSEDSEELITVLPPMARVEPGKTQKVRFVLTSNEPLQTERLKRVTFEGVPPKVGENESKVRVTFIQNLPVIIRPSGLDVNLTPWEGLKWRLINGGLEVSNPTSYVVRLGQALQTLPDGASWTLTKPYILPGETLTMASGNSASHGVAKHVRISPATTWGFTVDKYDAEILSD